MLKVQNLQKNYNTKRVVNNVSFELDRGEIVGLLGPNGAGKTTSFYMTLGLVKPDVGRVFLDNKEVTHFPIYERARLGLAYLPQEASIFRKLTVSDNIEAVLQLKYKEPKEIKERAKKLIADLHLEKVADQMGFTLSGGERRRCEIARALAVEPRYILFDEPFAGVDPIAVLDIQDLIMWLCEQGLGILITDHNVRETLRVTHHSYVIYAGEILQSGTPKEIIANPEVREKYLGKDFRL